jgi:lysozyme
MPHGRRAGPELHGRRAARAWRAAAQEIATLLALLGDHYGRRPILYVTSEFDWAYLRGRFDDETFWTRSIVLPPWCRADRWLIWQYHNCGWRAGVNGPVDLNAFRRSKRDFEAFVAGVV